MPGPDEQKKAQEELLKRPEAKHFADFLFGRNKDENPEDIQCPVCGYYCLGKGGFGCIDKPTLCRLKEERND
jgi:hypothetical protein